MFSSLTGVFIKQPSYIYIYIILNYFLENFLYIFAPYSLPFLRFPNRYPDHFPFHIPHKKEQSRYVSINRLSTNLRSVYGLLHSPTTRPFLQSHSASNARSSRAILVLILAQVTAFVNS